MRAYAAKMGDRWVPYVEPPRLNTFLRFDTYGKSEKEVVDWLKDLGYKVVTKEESYERSEKSSRGSDE